MNLLSMSVRNITRNWRRSLLSAVAIVISVTGIVFLFGLMNGFKDNLTENVYNFISGELRIRTSEFEKYEQLSPLHLAIPNASNVRATAAGHPAVRSAVARVSFGGIYFKDDRTFNLQLLGVDFAQEEEYLNISSLLTEGRLPDAHSNEVLVGGEFLERFDLSIGARITVLVTTFRRGSNAFSVDIVGIIDFPYAQLSRDTVMIPLKRAQWYLRGDDMATEVLIKLHEGSLYPEVRQELAALYGQDARLNIKHWSEIGSAATLLRTTAITYLVIAIIFLVLSSTVIVNTTMMVIYERIKEIGMLGAIGMSSAQIVILFYIEALCIGILGALCGLLFGGLLNEYFARVGLDMSNSLSGSDFQISNIIYPRNTLTTMIRIFFYALVVSGIATLIPSMRCAKIVPVEALHEE